MIGQMIGQMIGKYLSAYCINVLVVSGFVTFRLSGLEFRGKVKGCMINTQ